jgi:hypothetical protein
LPSVQYETPRPESWRGAIARAVAFAVAVRPDQLAGLAVERDHRAPRAGRGVEHALIDERRAFELELGRVPRLSVLNRQATSSLLKLRR